MVYSMTGYGKANLILNGRDITVEIKSVNHRYFEYTGKMHRSFIFLDDRIKKRVQSRVARGKVEVMLTVKTVDYAQSPVEVNLPLAESYLTALKEISSHLDIPLTADRLAVSRYEGVITQAKDETDQDALWRDVNTVLQAAVDEFLAMRLAEGEKLYQDISSRLTTVENIVDKIEAMAPDRVKNYREKLYSKLQEILADKQIDESRILTEAAIFADKAAVDEETSRLHSHVDQYRKILISGEPRGRKLDFLTQELNREANTIGSKSNDLGITSLVVDLKSEIEKIREQIQNIE